MNGSDEIELERGAASPTATGLADPMGKESARTRADAGVDAADDEAEAEAEAEPGV